MATIRAEAERAGRDLAGFGWYAYVFVSLHDDPQQARRDAADFLGGTYRSDFDAMVDRVACVGDTEQVIERLRAFVAAGADHLVLVPCGPSRQDSARRLMADVLPAREGARP